jgi:predicted MFS family arabinose efflux permease
MDPHWIATAFGAINSIRVLFYLPQILAVARSTDGARDIALSTWALWALTNALGAAYGAVVARDALLAVSFALSMLACLATLAMAITKRLRWRRAASANPRPCRSAVSTPSCIAQRASARARSRAAASR